MKKMFKINNLKKVLKLCSGRNLVIMRKITIERHANHALVTGIDVEKEKNDINFLKLKFAVMEKGVAVVKNQNLTDVAMVDFAKR